MGAENASEHQVKTLQQLAENSDGLIVTTSSAKDILNFQITWNMVFFIGFGSFIVYSVIDTRTLTGEDSQLLRLFAPTIFIGVMFLYNAILTIINTINIYNDRKLNYYPKFRFIK